MNSREAATILYSGISDPVLAAELYYERQEALTESRAIREQELFDDYKNDEGSVLDAFRDAALDVQDLDIKTITSFYADEDHTALGMVVAKLMDKQIRLMVDGELS